MTEKENIEPYAGQYELSPDFSMPERREQPVPYHLPEIVGSDSREVLEYGLSLPSEAFMQFVKENGSSPAVILSMLVGEAVQKLHPDADAPVMSIIPVSIRRQLGCEETFKNCSSRVLLPVCGTLMDALPFDQRAAQLRATLKQQMNPDIFRATYNMFGKMNRNRMEQATDYMEELKKPATFSMITHDTFYIDYIGSMHKTGYSEKLTDVRFLCQPAGGKTLHLNVIEHNGEFRVTCLAKNDISNIAAELDRVIRDHGIPVNSIPVKCFTLPLTAWREGIL